LAILAAMMSAHSWDCGAGGCGVGRHRRSGQRAELCLVHLGRTEAVAAWAALGEVGDHPFSGGEVSTDGARKQAPSDQPRCG
jgi:hypothetical protein